MRRDSTPEEILLAIKARIIDQVPLANESTCVINSDPDGVPSPMPGEYHYVISQSPSFMFDQGMFDGGGKWQCTTNWVFAVTVHSRNNNDQMGSDEVFLTSQDLGVFPQIGMVLTALSGHDLEGKDGDNILDQAIIPSDGNVHRPSKREGSVQIGFSLMFDWDLGAVYPTNE